MKETKELKEQITASKYCNKCPFYERDWTSTCLKTNDRIRDEGNSGYVPKLDNCPYPYQPKPNTNETAI